MSNLYKLSQTNIDIMHELEANGGEFTPELEEKFDRNNTSIELKAKSIISIVATKADNIVACDKEISRIQAIKKNNQKSLDSVSEYLKNSMMVMDKSEIDLGTATVKVKKCGASVVVLDESKIPREFFITKTPEPSDQLDIMKVREALKIVNVEGVRLETNKKRLEIK